MRAMGRITKIRSYRYFRLKLFLVVFGKIDRARLVAPKELCNLEQRGEGEAVSKNLCHMHKAGLEKWG